VSINVRVLHVMWRMSIGGAERAVYQLVREQRRRGTEADIAVASEIGIYGERSREAGAVVHELGCRRALDLTGSRRLTRLADGYDIVHHHGIEPLLIAASARARSPRLVYTHRGGVREHGWRKRLRVRLAKPCLRRFAALSGNTRQSAYVLARYLGIPERDVAVVYNGLDFELLDPVRAPEDVRLDLPPWAPDVFLVGTAANLQPLKRVHFLLEAVARLDDPLVRCLVLGDGPDRERLEELTAALELGDRVAFLGRRDHIGDYLQLLDAFVLPSGPQEAFGNAAVEAMAVGIPTVVFEDGGGLTEHVVDRVTGRVVPDVDSLAEALSELIRDENLRHRLGAEGRLYVRAEYSLDPMADRCAALYARALAGRHP
jgi:glycosyltransferase involved in cell wall biosynthesis